MSYIKNENIKPCPLCGSQAHRVRKHRSWVCCSNENCGLWTALVTRFGSWPIYTYHYKDWNNFNANQKINNLEERLECKTKTCSALLYQLNQEVNKGKKKNG